MEEPWHEEGMLARELAQCPRQVDSGPGELVEGTGWKKQIHDKGRWLGSGDCHHNGGGGKQSSAPMATWPGLMKCEGGQDSAVLSWDGAAMLALGSHVSRLLLGAFTDFSP